MIVALPLIDIYPAALYTLIWFWGDNCHVHARPDPSSLWERVWLARLVCGNILNKKQQLQYMWPPICTVQRHNFRVHHPHSSRYLSLPTTHQCGQFKLSFTNTQARLWGTVLCLPVDRTGKTYDLQRAESERSSTPGTPSPICPLLTYTDGGRINAEVCHPWIECNRDIRIMAVENQWWVFYSLVCKERVIQILSLSHHRKHASVIMALPLDSRALAVPFRVFRTPRLRSRAAVTLSRRSASTQTESPHSEFNTYYARLQSQKLYDAHIPTTPFQKAILMCGSAIGSFVAPERDSESTNHIPQ